MNIRDYQHELDSLSNNPSGVSSVNNTIVPINNRTIEIPIALTDVVVEGDVNSRKLTFQISRYFDGIDLSQKSIRVKYFNADSLSGYNDIQNIQLDIESFTFDWLISSEVSYRAGEVLIAFSFIERNALNQIIYEWQTKPSTFNVEKSFTVKSDAVAHDYSYQELFIDTHSNETTYNQIHDIDAPIPIFNRRILMPVLNDVVVSKDSLSQVITFTLDRHFDGVDLFGKVIAIKFINALGMGDRAHSINAIALENTLSFGWLLDGNVTIKDGYVEFAIEFLGYNEKNEFYCWQTTPAQIYVSKGLDVDSTILPPSPSWIQEWEIESAKVLTDAKNYYDMTVAEADKASISAVNAAASAKDALDCKTAATLLSEAAHSSELAAAASATVSLEKADMATIEAERATTEANRAALEASNVHDVYEVALMSELPTLGESEKIYIVYGDSEVTNGTYRWNGIGYESIGNAITVDNITISNSDQGISAVAIKEINKNSANKTWRGTKAEYDALGVNVDDNTTYIVTDDPESGGDGVYLRLTGDKMTGRLSLSADPVDDLDATPKRYVDDCVSAAGSGDMMKAVYDSDDNGVVSRADTAGRADTAARADSAGRADTAGRATSADAVAWAGVTGKPGSFTPVAHSHTRGQITDFPASLPANGGNADTVDGSHAWQMQTLSEAGATHGPGAWLLQCRFNATKDSLFRMIIVGSVPRGISVDRADYAGNAGSAGNADTVDGFHIAGAGTSAPGSLAHNALFFVYE